MHCMYSSVCLSWKNDDDVQGFKDPVKKTHFLFLSSQMSAELGIITSCGEKTHTEISLIFNADTELLFMIIDFMSHLPLHLMWCRFYAFDNLHCDHMLKLVYSVFGMQHRPYSLWHLL